MNDLFRAAVSPFWTFLCTAAILLTGQQRSTVFLGDSIIAKLGGPDNLAVSGAPTSRILEQAKKVPASAKAIFYEGGINDIGNGWDDQIVPNYRKIFGSRPYSAKPYLIGILPVEEELLEPSWKPFANNAKIARLNDQIAALCPSCVRVKVQFPPGSYQPDGIHLTPVGYDALKRAISAAQ